MNDFAAHREFSAAKADQETIRGLIGGCVRVVPASSLAMDKRGVDYVATLSGGATVNVDLKRRHAGASKYWHSAEPELALETWSIVPENGERGLVGWTLDESKLTDVTIHLFDPKDWPDPVILPFQHLRMAFHRRRKEWEQRYGLRYQESQGQHGKWRGQCVFVPLSEVMAAIMGEMSPKRAA